MKPFVASDNDSKINPFRIIRCQTDVRYTQPAKIDTGPITMPVPGQDDEKRSEFKTELKGGGGSVLELRAFKSRFRFLIGLRSFTDFWEQGTFTDIPIFGIRVPERVAPHNR
jgi:hypothetical protein